MRRPAPRRSRSEALPPSAANDGYIQTLYWPGSLVRDNSEWLELDWEKPATFAVVTRIS